MHHRLRACAQHPFRDARRPWSHEQHRHEITPLDLSMLLISALKTWPAWISSILFASLLLSALTSVKTSAASSRGITTTPSVSPTMMSPGITTVLPQAIGTLISPGPSLSQPPAD